MCIACACCPRSSGLLGEDSYGSVCVSRVCVFVVLAFGPLHVWLDVLCARQCLYLVRKAEGCDCYRASSCATLWVHHPNTTPPQHHPNTTPHHPNTTPHHYHTTPQPQQPNQQLDQQPKHTPSHHSNNNNNNNNNPTAHTPKRKTQTTKQPPQQPHPQNNNNTPTKYTPLAIVFFFRDPLLGNPGLGC